MACHSGNLRQLVGKCAVNATAIELVVLKTKRQVIYQRRTEGVIPVDAQYRSAFEGSTAIADRCRKT